MQSLACPRTHGTNACLTTHHLFFICWAFSSAQVPSRDDNSHSAKARIFLFLALGQRENLLETKPVDVRLRRKEGHEGKSFSDLMRRKQRLVTAKQFSLPRLRSDSVVRRPWKGAQTSCHQQTTQETKRKCCHELDEGCLGWCATRGQRRNHDDAKRPSQPADLKEHVHYTSWTFLLSARIKDPIWSHSNETDLHLRF